MQYRFDPKKHERIFGKKTEDPLETGTGKWRKCKITGQWLRKGDPRGHNARKEPPKRNPNLSAPQLAPAFEAFRTGVLEGAETITSRNEKREYMERKGLVEHEEGVDNGETWVTAKDEERQLVEDIKTFAETDTEADVWDTYHESAAEAEGDLDTEGADIETDDMVIID